MLGNISFTDSILAVHIAAVVVGLGVTFAYPVMFTVGPRQDPRSLPTLYRIEHAIGTRLVTPGLTVALLAGIYLASEEHQWGKFYVAWGLGAVIVLGALGGAFFSPTEKRLVDLSTRDVAAAGEGPVKLSAEHDVLARRLAVVGALSGLLVVVTVYFMATHAGA